MSARGADERDATRGRRASAADAAPQTLLTLAAFGAEGSFSEEAAERYLEREGLRGRVLSSPDLEHLFALLDERAADLVCLPVANSIGGLVRATFEVLGRHLFAPLGQVDLPVRHALLVRPGTQAASLRAVASHPQALAQCERYLARSFPHAERIEWNDTASAARDLAGGRLAATTAVLASLRAAQRFGLEPLERDVQDVRDNRTTFLILGPRER